MQKLSHFRQYAHLMRLNKPIGLFLLLWPTLWALWLACHGEPNAKLIFIFVFGVILMRSAGCVLNDVFDRKVDGHVKRTAHRPLPSGEVTVKEALFLAAFLILCAFFLVLLCNPLTIGLSIVGLILAVMYPLLKRFTYLPQVGLGAAFSWGVPMAFAAKNDYVPLSAWFIFATGIIWPIIYDTMYAMVDRIDDEKIGIKSTAILFNTMDTFVIGLLQLLFMTLLIIAGLIFHLHFIYYQSLCIVAMLFLYQQWLIKDRNTERCFKAFLNNNWVGLVIFIGILSSYHL